MDDWSGFPFDPQGRNRLPDDQMLGILDLRVIDEAGVEHRYDPNSIAVAGMGGELRHLPPDQSKASVISSRSGCLTCRSLDLSIDLTPDEADRLVRHALKPNEYKALGKMYGLTFEWHEDFYDPRTCLPEQPIMAPWDE